MNNDVSEEFWLSPPAAAVLLATGNPRQAMGIDDIPAEFRECAVALKISHRVGLPANATHGEIRAEMDRECGNQPGKYEIAIKGLTTLMRSGGMPFTARRAPEGRRRRIHPAEFSGLTLRGCDAVDPGTDRVVLWDLRISGSRLARGLRDFHQRQQRAASIEDTRGETRERTSSEAKISRKRRRTSESRRRIRAFIRGAFDRDVVPAETILWDEFFPRVWQALGVTGKTRGYGERTIRDLVAEEKRISAHYAHNLGVPRNKRRMPHDASNQRSSSAAERRGRGLVW